MNRLYRGVGLAAASAAALALTACAQLPSGTPIVDSFPAKVQTAVKTACGLIPTVDSINAFTIANPAVTSATVIAAAICKAVGVGARYGQAPLQMHAPVTVDGVVIHFQAPGV